MRSLGPSRSLLGESPLWSSDHDALYWLDLLDCTLHSWTADAGERSVQLPLAGPLGPLVPAAAGVAVTTSGGELFAVDLASGATRPLGRVLPRDAGSHVNDGKTDRSGRLWVGTADDAEEEASGALFRLDPQAAGPVAHSVDSGFVVSNGPAFSPDGSVLYFNDTVRGTVRAYPLSPSGEPGEHRVIARFSEEGGMPDGLTVDVEGDLWIGLWGGGAIVRLSPDGAVRERIDVPSPNVTSVAFGGRGLSTLFVTTAHLGLSDDERATHPGAGGCYAFEPGVSGIPEAPWKGLPA